MLNLSNLPEDPGVYLFKDDKNDIIYVGKAINLRKRISSYFKKQDSPKTVLLVKHIANVECIIVTNELEALLLENKLIKQHYPKYNINLKDSKTYAYIVISDEKYPRIFSSRKALNKGHIFGPFVDARARIELIQLIIQLFKIRVCRTLPKKACLNYHIGICTAPCIKEVNSEQYRLQVDQALEFLAGNTHSILKKLKNEMTEAADRKQYEKALAFKKQIEAIDILKKKQSVDLVKCFDQDVIAMSINHQKALIELFSISKGVISGKKEFSFDLEEELLEQFITLYYSKNYVPSEIIVSLAFWDSEKKHQALEEYLSKLKGAKVNLIYPQRGEKADLIKLVQKNAEYNSTNPILQEIKEKLSLTTLPITIECFDISNLGYDHIVGAMTQFVAGRANQAGYRKFEIRNNEGQDDFAAMREVVFRRYSRLLEEKKQFPDLIIIDGGAAHLAAALDSLGKIGISIPIIALAKEQEEIYMPGRKIPLQFNQNSPMMLYLRKIRDSVHEFVLSYNRKKRQIRLRKETHDKS
ncbi:excinuclease ABC subunit UvrC [Candidatus Woesearchaeota archaeon]|nr:excinuclease ABC subunit UvrC [Candidatus Woesearchaeota archaeon]